jgi:hypothetical protein
MTPDWTVILTQDVVIVLAILGGVQSFGVLALVAFFIIQLKNPLQDIPNSINALKTAMIERLGALEFRVTSIEQTIGEHMDSAAEKPKRNQGHE